MKRHVRVHTGAKPFSCRHCLEGFGRLDQLKRHLLKSHNEGIWFTCHICQNKFSCKGYLKKHMQRHEGVKPYVCDECPKRFCTAFELNYHQPVHSDYRQFCCFLCNAMFKREEKHPKDTYVCLSVPVLSNAIYNCHVSHLYDISKVGVTSEIIRLCGRIDDAGNFRRRFGTEMPS